jgi:protein-tyrosine phosphatase
MKRFRRNLLLVVLFACLLAWLWVEWLERSYREEPYTLIEAHLYTGTSVPEPPPGTEAVLNLCNRKDPYRVEVHLQDGAGDGKAPDITWLRRMVEFIAAQKQQGHTVFVHCNAGASRSALVVVAYLMYAHGWERDRALEFARSRRPQLQPNIESLQLLAEWESVLREEGRIGGSGRRTHPDSQESGSGSLRRDNTSQARPPPYPSAPRTGAPGTTVRAPKICVPAPPGLNTHPPTAVAVAPRPR